MRSKKRRRIVDTCPLNPPSRSVGDAPDKPDRLPLVFGHLGVSCQSNDHEGVLSDAGDCALRTQLQYTGWTAGRGIM